MFWCRRALRLQWSAATLWLKLEVREWEGGSIRGASWRVRNFPWRFWISVSMTTLIISDRAALMLISFCMQWKTHHTATLSNWGRFWFEPTCMTWRTSRATVTTRTTELSASRSWPGVGACVCVCVCVCVFLLLVAAFAGVLPKIGQRRRYSIVLKLEFLQLFYCSQASTAPTNQMNATLQAKLRAYVLRAITPTESWTVRGHWRDVSPLQHQWMLH